MPYQTHLFHNCWQQACWQHILSTNSQQHKPFFIKAPFRRDPCWHGGFFIIPIKQPHQSPTPHQIPRSEALRPEQTKGRATIHLTTRNPQGRTIPLAIEPPPLTTKGSRIIPLTPSIPRSMTATDAFFSLFTSSHTYPYSQARKGRKLPQNSYIPLRFASSPQLHIAHNKQQAHTRKLARALLKAKRGCS